MKRIFFVSFLVLMGIIISVNVYASASDYFAGEWKMNANKNVLSDAGLTKIRLIYYIQVDPNNILVDQDNEKITGISICNAEIFEDEPMASSIGYFNLYYNGEMALANIGIWKYDSFGDPVFRENYDMNFRIVGDGSISLKGIFYGSSSNMGAEEDYEYKEFSGFFSLKKIR